MNAIFAILNPNNTVTINRPLAHAIGLNETIAYGALLAKYQYYSENGLLYEGEWFFRRFPTWAKALRSPKNSFGFGYTYPCLDEKSAYVSRIAYLHPNEKSRLTSGAIVFGRAKIGLCFGSD